MAGKAGAEQPFADELVVEEGEWRVRLAQPDRQLGGAKREAEEVGARLDEGAGLGEGEREPAVCRGAFVGEPRSGLRAERSERVVEERSLGSVASQAEA